MVRRSTAEEPRKSKHTCSALRLRVSACSSLLLARAHCWSLVRQRVLLCAVGQKRATTLSHAALCTSITVCMHIKDSTMSTIMRPLEMVSQWTGTSVRGPTQQTGNSARTYYCSFIVMLAILATAKDTK